jgi:hypothetical protein
MATEWYYISGNDQLGPVGSNEIRRMAAKGTLTPDHKVWNVSVKEWIEARHVSGLKFGSEDQPAVDPEDAEEVELTVEPQLQTKDAPELASQVIDAVEGQSSDADAAPAADPNFLTAPALGALRATRQWVLTLATLMVIGVGAMAAGALAMIVIGATGAHPNSGIVALGVTALMFAAMSCIPLACLGKYYSSIGTLMQFRQPGDLEVALVAQKAYWKSVALVSIIILTVYIVVAIDSFGRQL